MKSLSRHVSLKEETMWAETHIDSVKMTIYLQARKRDLEQILPSEKTNPANTLISASRTMRK
jgi:hypothetical protein